MGQLLLLLLLLLLSVGWLHAGEPTVAGTLCLAAFWPSSEPERETQTLRALEELKPGQLRVELSMPSKEKEEQQARRLREAGFSLIGLLTGSPPYRVPEDLSHFETQVYQTVTAYRDLIHVFEIWNEQNAGYRFWQPKEDPAAYARLLKAAYRGVKRANPDAQVLYGGLYYHAQIITGAEEFLEQSFTAQPDLAGYFDALAFHPYSLYPPSRPPEHDKGGQVPLPEMVRRLTNILREAGAEKPIYATELGWPIYGRVTEQLQAAYLVRAMILAIVAGVQSSCWFTLHDNPSYPPGTFPPEGSFGLMRPFQGGAYPKKPSFFAYKTLSHHLGKSRPAADLREKLHLLPSQHAYLFRREPGEQIIFWDVDEKAASQRHVELQSPARLIGTTGETLGELPAGPALLTFQHTPTYLICEGACL